MRLQGRGDAPAKLAVMVRDMAWWEGELCPFPAAAHQDFYLPVCVHVGAAHLAADAQHR